MISVPSTLLRLGPLACYYDAPKLPPGLSKKLLSQLANCDNPRITQVSLTCSYLAVLSHMSVFSQDRSDKCHECHLLSSLVFLSYPDSSWRSALSRLWWPIPSRRKHYVSLAAVSPCCLLSNCPHSLPPISKAFSKTWDPRPSGQRASSAFWSINSWSSKR